MSTGIVNNVINGNIDEVRDFLKGDVDIQGPLGLTLSELAMSKNQFEIFKLLLGAGVNAESLNKIGMNLLHRSIVLGKLEYSTLLLEGGYVDINSVDADGNTPLHLAAGMIDNKAVKLLTSPKFRKTLKRVVNNTNGKTALQIAASVPHEEVIKTLVGCKDKEQERLTNKMFLDIDLHLEDLLNSASDKIADLKKKLEEKTDCNCSVSETVLKTEIDRLKSEMVSSGKSLNFKDKIIERQRSKIAGLKESILEEKLNNETLVSNMEKMQAQLDLAKEVDSLQQQVNRSLA